MPSPIINKYLEELNQKLEGEEDNFFYAFRGRPSSELKLDCSAVRNFDEEDKFFKR